jgi:acetyltransferase
MALVALVREKGADGAEHERVVGVSRYVTNPDGTSCEFSLVVADDFKGRGLGSRLMLAIMDAARAKGLTEIMGLILADNTAMLRLMASLGFAVAAYPEDPDFKVATKAL